MTDAALDANTKPYSVSELAFALKRTIEANYGFVRLRGELSKVTFHSSGHVYLDLKDDRACISGVIWKTAVRGLAIRPQTGLEVVVTGKITTYPGRSQYQIVIETVEPAGIGALLAQLERLKAQLTAEGLFAPERKRALPAMPATIGVITSPTGAVIRDILHRIRDRWPCRVIVWPVVVQGDQAAAQVAAALRGFDSMTPGGPVPRPDLLIVARGGGSVEDLWPFNDEALVRAAAAVSIPLISAVGHETDTTLIDFAADRRAPTPTAAAEMATPVIAELRAGLADFERRLARTAGRLVEDRRARLVAAGRGLPRPDDLLALAQQRFDNAAARLGAGLERNAAVHERDLLRIGARLSPSRLEERFAVAAQRLKGSADRLSVALERSTTAHGRDLQRLAARLSPARLEDQRVAAAARLKSLAARLSPPLERRFERLEERLARLDQLRRSLDPDRPLSRGFARVERAGGGLVVSAASLEAGEAVQLVFSDGRRGATIDGAAASAPAPRAVRPAKPSAPPSAQGDLF